MHFAKLIFNNRAQFLKFSNVTRASFITKKNGSHKVVMLRIQHFFLCDNFRMMCEFLIRRRSIKTISKKGIFYQPVLLSNISKISS